MNEKKPEAQIPPNILELAKFIHSFPQPKELRSKFAELLSLCTAAAQGGKAQ